MREPGCRCPDSGCRHGRDSCSQTLSDNGVTNFVILEARDEIGGRMRVADFAGVEIELGANWIQGVDPCIRIRMVQSQSTLGSQAAVWPAGCV